jgi:hypothetical protein
VCNSYHCPFKHRYFTLLQRYTHVQESIKFENLTGLTLYLLRIPKGRGRIPYTKIRIRKFFQSLGFARQHKNKNPKILSVSWFCAAMLLLPLLIRGLANPEGQRKDHFLKKKDMKINPDPSFCERNAFITPPDSSCSESRRAEEGANGKK